MKDYILDVDIIKINVNILIFLKLEEIKMNGQILEFKYNKLTIIKSVVLEFFFCQFYYIYCNDKE